MRIATAPLSDYAQTGAFSFNAAPTRRTVCGDMWWGFSGALATRKQKSQLPFEKLMVEPPPPTLFKYWVPVHHPPQFSNIGTPICPSHTARFLHFCPYQTASSDTPIHTRMAHTLTQYWYALTPKRAVALIGEDHMGEWTRTPAGVAVVDAVVEWHTSRRRVPTLWHEGESSAISDSFKAFTAHFKKEYGISYTVKKWEPPQSAVKYTRENLLLIGLMAGDAGQTRRHLGSSGIYIERLLQTDSWKAESGTRYTADEILELVDKGVHAKRYRELLYSEITDSTLREWFQLREEAFENPQSKLYKIMSEPQYSREDGLARLLRSQNGIYLVGESHIPTMRDRGLLK